MSGFKDANVRDGAIEYIVRIANAICGEEETPYTGPQDKFRRSLERLAEHFEKEAGKDNG